MRFHAQLALVLLTAAALTACSKPPAAPTANVQAVTVKVVPNDPGDAAWIAAPECLAKLLPQDLVEPRLMKASTPEVRVRTLVSDREIGFRLQWNDNSDSDLPGAALFSDACAVQIPAKVDPNVPAPQMGEAGKSVQITYWNAAWQAVVDGRGDTIKDLYPNASVDHYPFEAPPLAKGSETQQAMAARYSPARALENQMAGPRKTPVQDLLAEGPGTITAAPSGDSNGCGKRAAGGWSVVIIRKLPAGFDAQTGTQVAFAVWEGAQEEVGPRKMRTGWIPLVLQAGQGKP